MANAYVHPLFAAILEPLMSKPRTQAELDAYNAEMPNCQSIGGECPYPGACRVQHFCNCAGGVQPRVDTSLRGRTYERRILGATRDGNVPVYEQVESGTL